MSLFIRPARDLSWLAVRAGCALTSDANGVEAVDENGVIRGQVGFDQWTENSAQTHMAVDAPHVWLSLLKPALRYPFQELGKGLLLGIIPAHRTEALRFAKGVGFREAYRLEDGWDKGDALVVLKLRREHCRFLEVNHG